VIFKIFRRFDGFLGFSVFRFLGFNEFLGFWIVIDQGGLGNDKSF
jgi:hypothetical protein